MLATKEEKRELLHRKWEEQIAASVTSVAESAIVSGRGNRSEIPASGSSTVIRPSETAEEDENIIIITIPADSPEGNDADSIIVKDDSSLLLPSVQNSDID